MRLVSQLRHSLVVHPLLKKILDPPLIWIIITELPNTNIIVTFTKRVQIQLRQEPIKFDGLLVKVS